MTKMIGAEPDQGQTDDPLTDDRTYAGQVFYIDSEGGDDSKDGLSPATAWKTIKRAEQKFRLRHRLDGKPILIDNVTPRAVDEVDPTGVNLKDPFTGN